MKAKVAEETEIHLKTCLFWALGERKASYMQFVVNGLKRVKVLACSFKQHEHTLRLFAYAVCDEGEKATLQWG